MGVAATSSNRTKLLCCFGEIHLVNDAERLKGVHLLPVHRPRHKAKK